MIGEVNFLKKSDHRHRVQSQHLEQKVGQVLQVKEDKLLKQHLSQLLDKYQHVIQEEKKYKKEIQKEQNQIRKQQSIESLRERIAKITNSRLEAKERNRELIRRNEQQLIEQKRFLKDRILEMQQNTK